MFIGWLTARELINTGLLIGDLCVVFVLLRMLSQEWKTAGWFRHAYNQAALALLIHFGGMSLTRAWAAMLLWQVERGGDIIAIENTYPISMFGAGLSFIGVLMVVKVFSPANWRSGRAWMIVLVLTGILTALTYATFNITDATREAERERISKEIMEVLEQ